MIKILIILFSINSYAISLKKTGIQNEPNNFWQKQYLKKDFTEENYIKDIDDELAHLLIKETQQIPMANEVLNEVLEIQNINLSQLASILKACLLPINETIKTHGKTIYPSTTSLLTPITSIFQETQFTEFNILNSVKEFKFFNYHIYTKELPQICISYDLSLQESIRTFVHELVHLTLDTFEVLNLEIKNSQKDQWISISSKRKGNELDAITKESLIFNDKFINGLTQKQKISYINNDLKYKDKMIESWKTTLGSKLSHYNYIIDNLKYYQQSLNDFTLENKNLINDYSNFIDTVNGSIEKRKKNILETKKLTEAQKTQILWTEDKEKREEIKKVYFSNLKTIQDEKKNILIEEENNQSAIDLIKEKESIIEEALKVINTYEDHIKDFKKRLKIINGYILDGTSMPNKDNDIFNIDE